MVNDSLGAFISALGSKNAVPGGGGGCALVGGCGIALGNMVCGLTLGKKKYAEVEDIVLELSSKADMLQTEFLKLIEEDALVFEPLSKAYVLPKTTTEEIIHKEKVMEVALEAASLVPLRIMEKALEAILIQEKLSKIGAKIAISDVGVGVLFLKAALSGASLNVFINTKAMTDKKKAEEINTKAFNMLKTGEKIADEIFEYVRAQLL